MFDKILEKAQEAMTLLSKTLSSFEMDSSRLKIKFEEQIAEYHKRIDEELRKLNTLSSEEIRDKKKELEFLLFNHKMELSSLLLQHQEHLEEVIKKDLGDFSKIVKERFESLYAEYEVQAVRKAEETFEADLTEIFKKYGDKFAPYIFKSLLRYIFKFGKK
jgi:hypothetical protein